MDDSASGRKDNFGWELILNLYDCDSKVITSEKELKMFIFKLCEIINVKSFGKPLIKRFGEENTKAFGYSVIQLVETSSITLHVSEKNKAVYMNIFSCRKFDKDAAKDFCASSFSTQKYVEQFILRP